MYQTLNEQKKELRRRVFILFSGISILLAIGTVVYHFSEGWTWLDSIYFATISLTSRGFSQMHPTHWFSVLFSVFYLLIGVGVIVYSIASLVAFYTAFYERKVEKKVQTIVENIKTKATTKKPDKWLVFQKKS